MNLIKVFGCFFFLFRLHKPVSYPYCFCLFFYVPKRVRLQFLAIISFSYVIGMEPNGLTTVMAFWGRNRRSQTYGTVSVPIGKGAIQKQTPCSVRGKWEKAQV